jgi:hypothetical protein
MVVVPLSQPKTESNGLLAGLGVSQSDVRNIARYTALGAFSPAVSC